MKIAILEDNKEQLKDRIQQIEENKLAEVVLFAYNSAEFFEKLKLASPEALIIDIDLGQQSMSGIEVANRTHLPVLFVSAFNSANLKEIEALERNFDYPVAHLSKPITEIDFVKTFKKFEREVIHFIESNLITLNLRDNRKLKVPIQNIVCLETDATDGGSSNNKIIFFTDRKPEVLIDFSFSKMEEIGFKKELFVKPHKSYRLNINHLKEYFNHQIPVTVLDKEGKHSLKYIPVSENYRKVVLDSISK